MHGWAGDQRGWAPFAAAAERRGWSWRNGERGYGDLPVAMPAWQAAGRRALVVHSLGLHLLPAELLATADTVVLLASFGRFVPEGPAGRPLRQALAAMARQLQDGSGEAMLLEFLRRAAAPESADPAGLGIGDQRLQPQGRQRLLDDLALLESRTGLPEAFPSQARVLIVEAGGDQIVAPQARQLLRHALPDADVLQLGQASHCLLQPSLIPILEAWLAHP